MDDLPDKLILVVATVVILLVGTFALSQVVSFSDTDTDVQTAASLDGTQWTEIDDTVGTSETVYDSRGYAIKLDGSDDSYFTSESEFTAINSQNFTVSVWASFNTSKDMAVLTIGKNLVIHYNDSRGNWSAWYYDEGDRDSYRVDVVEQNSTDTLENIVVTREKNTLTIYSNATQGEQADLSTDNTAAAPNGSNWDGRIEELRVFSSSWSQADIQSHISNPIDPIPANATGRVMFDEPYRDYQLLFYKSGDINTNNVNFVSGLPGQKLVASDALFQQSDYEWSVNGPRIRAIAGGELENAPVAYVGYKSKGLVGNLVDDWIGAMGLMAVAIVLIPLGLILSSLYGMRRS